MLTEIISDQNPKFKLLKRLITKKGRYREGLFIAEGRKFLSMKAEMVFSIEESERSNYLLSKELFNQLSSLENSEGYISVFKFNHYKAEDLKGRAVILDRVQNPGNMGSIIRNMVAFGFENLILLNGCADPFSPKVVRASMGSILDVKVAHSTFEEIKGRYRIIAADSKGEELVDFRETNLGLVFGNESSGISEEILDNATRVRIPISDKIDSLNVAVASGIILYELTKGGK